MAAQQRPLRSNGLCAATASASKYRVSLAARKRIEWTDLAFKAHNKDVDYECDEVDDYDTVDTVDVTLAYDPVVAAQIAFIAAASKNFRHERSLAPRATRVVDPLVIAWPVAKRRRKRCAQKVEDHRPSPWRPRTSGSLFLFSTREP